MLDLRKPIAYYFIINAVVLVGYGLYKPGNVQIGQNILNLDLVWGGVMGAFGIGMFLWSALEKKKPTT
jgi:hypothetical protein